MYLIHSIIQNKNYGATEMDQWFLQGSWIQFAAPTWWSITIQNSRSVGSDSLFWPVCVPSINTVHIHTWKQNIYTHKLKHDCCRSLSRLNRTPAHSGHRVPGFPQSYLVPCHPEIFTASLHHSAELTLSLSRDLLRYNLYDLQILSLPLYKPGMVAICNFWSIQICVSIFSFCLSLFTHFTLLFLHQFIQKSFS